MFEFLGIEFQLVWFHISSLVFVVVITLLADSEGFSWLLGKKEMLNEKVVHKLHKFMWLGLLLMIFTGFIMFWPLREYLLTHTPFQIKMAFVLALLINAVFIGKLSKVASEKPFKELSKKQKFLLLVSGMVSFVGWIGAIISALLMNI